MNPTFWNGKKVLVTGHTGFKGSWLCLWLGMLGADVVGYALPPPTAPSLFEVAAVGDDVTSIMGDIRDYEKFLAVVAQHEPEIIIHLAAQSLVRHSYQEPVETYAVNLMGTVNVLETARRCDCIKVVLIVTSDKCYENRNWGWAYRENDAMGGHDPYSSSKCCAELAVAAYRCSFFNASRGDSHCVAVATARTGNVIGGGDWAPDRLFPDIMRAFTAKRPVKIRHPNAVRPWHHVLDPLHGYLLLVEHLSAKGCDFAQAWNFGPDSDQAKTVSWIVNVTSELWGGGATWVLAEGPHPHETLALAVDSTKARTLLNWRPQIPLVDAIQQTVAWYRNHTEHVRMSQVTKDEILSFQRLVS